MKLVKKSMQVKRKRCLMGAECDDEVEWNKVVLEQPKAKGEEMKRSIDLSA